MDKLIKEILLKNHNEHHLSKPIMDLLYHKCDICKKHLIKDKRCVVHKDIWIQCYLCLKCFEGYTSIAYYSY